MAQRLRRDHRSPARHPGGHPLGEEVRPGAGPPYWAGNAYLFGTWVYLESAIFYVVGPEVLVPILFNGVFALTAALLVYDIARRLFDRRSAFLALVLTAFYPSLVVWSSLNLKDALALLLAAICLWGLVRFQQRLRWAALAVAVGVLFPIQSLRPYLFFGLVVLVPLVVALTPALGLAARIRWTAAAGLATGLLLSLTQSGVDLSPQLLQTFEEQRQAMGLTARTRFVEAPPVTVKEGDTFVTAAAPAAAPTSAPSPTPGSATASAPATPVPSVVHVAPNTRIVIVTAAPAASPPGGTVYVRPGDLVVVGPPASTLEPPELRGVLAPAPAEDNLTLAPAQRSLNDLALRSIRYFPIGRYPGAPCI